MERISKKMQTKNLTTGEDMMLSVFVIAVIGIIALV